MPEIKTNLFAEPKQNTVYVITDVKQKDVKTDEGIKPALSVLMKNVDSDDAMVYSTTLWLTDNSTTTSKLGSFVLALGTNTDSWKNKKIKILSWIEKDREIEVIN